MSAASPRDRLLAVADELFNAHGIHAIGIDRVIAAARVAKATLYAHFPTKDHLVGAYLRNRMTQIRSELTEAAAAEFTDDANRVLATYSRIEEICLRPDFRGCTFINAAAEYGKDGPVLDVVGEYRRWIHEFYTDLVAAAGFTEPAVLGALLVQYLDGVMVSAHLDGDRAAPAHRARRSLAVVLSSWDRVPADQPATPS